MNKKMYIAVICTFSLLLTVSSGFLIKHYIDSEKQAEMYDNLIETVEKIDTEKDTMTYSQDKSFLSDYQALYLQNNDMVGWIKIEDTKINYPVMQSKDNPNFYLKHGFDKAYSNYGVPYIDEGCAPGLSNNIVIYGHHMNDGTMFADLCGYADRGFYEGHKTIRFDTLSGSGEYEVVAAFRFNTNRDTFRYNEYTNMDEAEFAEFLENVRARALYDTDMEVEYGDTLLTLSTCEYTYKNGRFVVVAKKVG